MATFGKLNFVKSLNFDGSRVSSRRVWVFVRGIIVEVTVTDGVARAWKRELRLDSANERMPADHVVPRAWGVKPRGPFLLQSLLKLH